MERVILHSDANCFYASVEMLHRPETKGKPLAVGGDEKLRHGIILTANYTAKKYGVKTGETIWQAKQKCPDLIIVPPNFALYSRFSKMLREIYGEYTDFVEPFGLDECWLDVSDSIFLFGGGYEIAKQISDRVKSELGITVSIGVSWNKIYAKLGSDYKKPDGITVFDYKNYKEKVFPLPVSDLLCVGRSTLKKLSSMGIHTIGDVASTNLEILEKHLGKAGSMLYSFANGYNVDPVQAATYSAPAKSISNGMTAPRDLTDINDVKSVLYTLIDSVCRRMRDQSFLCKTVGLTIRDNRLFTFTRQARLDSLTDSTRTISKEILQLFENNYTWTQNIRFLSVCVSDLVYKGEYTQLDLFGNVKQVQKDSQIDSAVDNIKNRFGSMAITRAISLADRELSMFNPYRNHLIRPVGYQGE